MTMHWEHKGLDGAPRDASEELYHEAQADGVPYDEDLEPESSDLPTVDLSRL